MLFNSVEFLIYFPIVVTGYFLLPQRWRWVWLLAASYYFYMSWRANYAFLLIFATVANYWIARWMEKLVVQRWRKLLLMAALTMNLGFLFIFKYFNFFISSAQTLLSYAQIEAPLPVVDFLLPVGISFYTFQKISYIVDVYRGQQPAEKNLGIFALFVAFFPQLVAGPIERTGNLLPQFFMPYAFDYDRVVSGLRRMAWGFFKKVVIADKVAVIVNLVYNNPTDYEGLPLVLATYLFAFQIYCDFSGYSDIAIGAARVLGINLMENFRQPYLSLSVSEFWRRWHISLSTWFRDYLYIPLGGNRVPVVRRYVNLFLVFVVSGLWHGANWTFVIWGGLHGAYLISEILLQQPLSRLSNSLGLTRFPQVLTGLRIFVVFHLVTFAWIFFRANTLTDAFYVVTHLFAPWQITATRLQLQLSLFTVMVIGCSILWMEMIEYARREGHFALYRQPVWVRWSSYYAIIMTILLLGELHGTGQFIYFQF